MESNPGMEVRGHAKLTRLEVEGVWNSGLPGPGRLPGEAAGLPHRAGGDRGSHAKSLYKSR